MFRGLGSHRTQGSWEVVGSSPSLMSQEEAG